MTIRTAVIEDVPLARERLQRMLAPHRDIVLVGEAGDMRAGADLIARAAPQLVFLDVTLPDGDGPSLLRRLPEQARPLIIFLTARADHAVPAFELQAVDYLLKPVGDESLSRALDRVRKRLDPHAGQREAETHIAIRNGRRTDLVRVDSIDYVEVAGHYLCLRVGRETHLLREPLVTFAERLETAGFVRCHRSALVRIAAIESIVDRKNGDGEIRLSGGATVPLSRTYREALRARLALRER